MCDIRTTDMLPAARLEDYAQKHEQGSKATANETKHTSPGPTTTTVQADMLVAGYFKATGRYTGAWKHVLNGILVAEGAVPSYSYSAQDHGADIPIPDGTTSTKRGNAITLHKNGYPPLDSKLEDTGASERDDLLNIRIQWRCTLEPGTNTAISLYEEVADFSSSLIARGWILERAIRRYLPCAKVTMLIGLPDAGM